MLQQRSAYRNFMYLEAELRNRPVRIFQPTRSTTQSGTGKSTRWRIDWDILQGSGRWENPLMGWASSYVSSIGYDTSLAILHFVVVPTICRALVCLSGRKKTPLHLLSNKVRISDSYLSERPTHSLVSVTGWDYYVYVTL